jgi:uncharacterized protein with HEPN domain
LEEIIENVQAIERYVAGMDAAAFEGDQKTYDAVERCLERISEAAAKLGDTASSLVPGQPWREIRALGNRPRHEYDAIRADRLWDVVQIDLPPLCAPVRMPCGDYAKGRRAGTRTGPIVLRSYRVPPASPRCLRVRISRTA